MLFYGVVSHNITNLTILIYKLQFCFSRKVEEKNI